MMSGFRDVELLRQRVVEKNDHKEIEGVQRPAEETRGDGVERGAARFRVSGIMGRRAAGYWSTWRRALVYCRRALAEPRIHIGIRWSGSSLWDQL